MMLPTNLIYIFSSSISSFHVMDKQLTLSGEFCLECEIPFFSSDKYCLVGREVGRGKFKLLISDSRGIECETFHRKSTEH